MASRGGRADLPLHYGRVPRWLGERMTKLGAVITQAIVVEHGRDEFLRRLANPFWFQSFGAVMGMDWHSSGITTSVIGALKRGLAPLSGELGLHVCGGRGAHSRKTPDELVAIGGRVGFDGGALARASRLVAKVDNAAVQDGFDLYLHGFIVADDGRWVVIQQGMNGERRQARRYHWLSEGFTSFVDDPHAAIDGRGQGPIVNLADRRAQTSRRKQLDLLKDIGPDGVARQVADLEGYRADAEPEPAQLPLPHLVMPTHHDVPPKTSSAAGSEEISPRPPMRRPAISPSFCSCRAWVRAPFVPWRKSRKFCMVRPAASLTRRASRSPMAARTDIPIPCR